MMDSAVSIYQNPTQYPNLSVPHYLVIEIIQVLALIDRPLTALKLIRGAYRREDGAWAALAEAEEIYFNIAGRDARRQVIKQALEPDPSAQVRPREPEDAA